MEPKRNEVTTEFDSMLEKFTSGDKETKSKELLNKIKKMEYTSKHENKAKPAMHARKVELFDKWRKFIRGPAGINLGDDYKSKFIDGQTSYQYQEVQSSTISEAFDD